MKVPLLDLKPQYAAIRDEIDEAIRRVVESQHFILGPEVEALEREIAEHCGAVRAVGCASGSDALLLVLMALDIGPGDQVICPSYTFFATAGAIARLGAVPVFVDIDPATYNLDPGRVRAVAARCERLAAIMPVHLFGRCADMDAFIALGDEFGVPIIEDAAQAIGSRDGQGVRAGSRGRAGCFSFFPSKNLGAFGDAGIITTSDEALADRMACLRVHGGRQRYYHDEVGFNSRLDALQAAVLRVKLRHLEDWSEARRANAAHYDRLFGSTRSIRTPAAPGAPATHIYNQYVIRVPAAQRDPLREHLKERGIGNEVYYPVPLHMQACFRGLGYAKGDLPESEACARETLALPIYPELTRQQREYVAEAVVEFSSKGDPLPFSSRTKNPAPSWRGA